MIYALDYHTMKNLSKKLMKIKEKLFLIYINILKKNWAKVIYLDF